MNLKEIVVRSKFKMMKMEIPKISDRAVVGYRDFVKGNKNEPTWLLRCKLLRNWNLAKQFYKSNSVVKKRYGNLVLVLNRRLNMIEYIWNNRGTIFDSKGNVVKTYIDEELKQKLNSIIGVNKDV